MGEFFKGWRRKTGVVTLVMACVFMSAWVRSQTTIDIGVLCLIQPHVLGVMSCERGIEMHYERNEEGTIGHETGWTSVIPGNAKPGSHVGTPDD